MKQRRSITRAYSIGTSITSTGGGNRRRSFQEKGGHTISDASSGDQRAKEQGLANQDSRIFHSKDGDTYVRNIVAGGSVNILCVLKVGEYKTTKALTARVLFCALRYLLCLIHSFFIP